MKWVLAIILASPLVAGDPLAQKTVAQMDEKQVTKLLNNSPWAKEALVTMPGATSGDLPGSGGGGGSGRRGGRGGGMSAGVPSASEGTTGPTVNTPGEMGGGGMGGGGSVPNLPKMTVRWQSAKPMLEGLGNKESAAKLAKLAEANYIILVGGMSLGIRRGPDGSPPDPERIAQLKKKLADATVLKRKGHEPMHPASVEQAGASLIFFVFPRTDPIDLDDKDVTFESSTGPLKLKAKFTLKDMMYQGQLAL